MSKAFPWYTARGDDGTTSLLGAGRGKQPLCCQPVIGRAYGTASHRPHPLVIED